MREGTVCMDEDLRYPIGRLVLPKQVSESHVEGWIRDLEEAPGLLRQAVAGLSDEQLDTPYREGGWTVRQVIHHLMDSHMNSFISMRLGILEDQPVLRATNVDALASLIDSKTAPIEPSLAVLDGLHTRWALLLRSLAFETYSRTTETPGRGVRSLGVMLGIYSFHGKHHTAHITALRKRMGW